MTKSAEAFRTISEVADWLGVPTHVLRFWESRFTQIKPVKRAGGRRYYRPADMALLGGIRKLLHEDGLTIRGVQKRLREEGVRAVAALSPPVEGADPDAQVPRLVPLRARTVEPAQPGLPLGADDAAGDTGSPEGAAPAEHPLFSHPAPGMTGRGADAQRALPSAADGPAEDASADASASNGEAASRSLAAPEAKSDAPAEDLDARSADTDGTGAPDDPAPANAGGAGSGEGTGSDPADTAPPDAAGDNAPGTPPSVTDSLPPHAPPEPGEDALPSARDDAFDAPAPEPAEAEPMPAAGIESDLHAGGAPRESGDDPDTAPEDGPVDAVDAADPDPDEPERAEAPGGAAVPEPAIQGAPAGSDAEAVDPTAEDAAGGGTPDGETSDADGEAPPATALQGASSASFSSRRGAPSRPAAAAEPTAAAVPAEPDADVVDDAAAEADGTGDVLADAAAGADTTLPDPLPDDLLSDPPADGGGTHVIGALRRHLRQAEVRPERLTPILGELEALRRRMSGDSP